MLAAVLSGMLEDQGVGGVTSLQPASPSQARVRW